MAARSRSTASNPGYPRPQLVRENWTSLNGAWDFAIDAEGEWRTAQQVKWSHTIQVPFAPETPASKVHDTSFYRAVWYQRTFPSPKLDPGHRLLLHFGAVDWEARVYVNGQLAATHEGGYTPFSADITDLLAQRDEQTLAVHALDDPHDMARPRGKQDWRLDPHSIWYHRTTGIWQTVWLEVVPATFISHLKWTPSVEKWELGLSVKIAGTIRDGLRLRVHLAQRDQVLADDTYALRHGSIDCRIGLPDPGIDDARQSLLWSPAHPNLIDAQIELSDSSGNVIDRVTSYTAMRSVGTQGDRFLLNGRPYYLRMALDQGYWPESGLTAPNDDALRRDVELARAMGFNGVRKHQKIEDPRFLYWADKLGLLVWEEMPSPFAFSDESIRRLIAMWTEAIERDSSHPCIVAWVPFNESWGVPDLPRVEEQRNFVKSVYFLTRSLDPTRPVIGNDGWESVVTDIIGIHDYEAQPQRLARRYTVAQHTLADMLRSERPGHRMLILDEAAHHGLPIMLTEFGGIAFSRERGSWGYSRARTPSDFAARYAELLGAVRSLPLLAGFCYTQLTDTHQEANGLLYMDRTPKFPLEQIAIATRGAATEAERKLEARWKQRLLSLREEK